MTHVTFTKEQMEWLKDNHNIDLCDLHETLPVRGGDVTKNTMVWWLGEEGPEQVLAEDDWDNIYEYPNAYSIQEPIYKVVYEYEEDK